jgi:hypothetical protein
MLRSLEGNRRGEPDELDAFLLGILHFALRAGHILPVAAIEALYRLGALADGRAHAIHRGVAAADDDDILARGRSEPSSMAGTASPKPLAVRSGEIVERLDHALRADARRLDVARLVDARWRSGSRHASRAALEAGVAADLEPR